MISAGLVDASRSLQAPIVRKFNNRRPMSSLHAAASCQRHVHEAAVEYNNHPERKWLSGRKMYSSICRSGEIVGVSSLRSAARGVRGFVSPADLGFGAVSSADFDKRPFNSSPPQGESSARAMRNSCHLFQPPCSLSNNLLLQGTVSTRTIDQLYSDRIQGFRAQIETTRRLEFRVRFF